MQPSVPSRPGSAPAPRRAALNAAAAAALVMQLAVGVVYASSGLVAPAWAVVVLLALWAGLTVLGVLLWRRGRLLVLTVPVVTALLWLAVVSAGGSRLGWTA